MKKPAERLPEDPTLIEEGVGEATPQQGGEEPWEDRHWAGVGETTPHQGGEEHQEMWHPEGRRSAGKGWGRSTPRNFN